MTSETATVRVAVALLAAAAACRTRGGDGGGPSARAAAAEVSPSPAKMPRHAGEDPPDGELPHSLLVARAMEDLRIRTASFDRLFQIGEADWELNQDTGEIVFTSPQGLVATAQAQIAGTYDTNDSTWLWAWANPSIAEPLTAHARLAQKYGKRHGVAELTKRKLKITEDKAWELTALTCKLGDDQGAYRGPAGHTMVFITFGEVTLKKR